MRVAVRISWLLVLAAGLVAARPARDNAEIFAITPETGPAGTEVRIKGRGLKGTKHVLFAVGGTAKTARFRVVSDEELEVVTPECYRPGAAATVAVLGPTGLAVAVPAAVQTIREGTRGNTSATEPGAGFYHVLRGGRVRSAESVALIERGGVVDHSRAPAMHLVKSGGVLMEFSNANGIVFHEHGAVLGQAMINPRHTVAQRFFHVPKITASPGVGPFIFQGVPRPDVARSSGRKAGHRRGGPTGRGGGRYHQTHGPGVRTHDRGPLCPRSRPFALGRVPNCLGPAAQGRGARSRCRRGDAHADGRDHRGADGDSGTQRGLSTRADPGPTRWTTPDDRDPLARERRRPGEFGGKRNGLHRASRAAGSLRSRREASSLLLLPSSSSSSSFSSSATAPWPSIAAWGFIRDSRRPWRDGPGSGVAGCR